MVSSSGGPDTLERVGRAIAVEGIKSLLPGGGVLLAAFRALFDKDFSQEFNQRVREDLQDQVCELQEAVRRLQAVLDAHGRKLDELDPIAYRRVIEEFVKSILDSTTPVQRRAIIAATARVFDPTLGSLALRHFWLQVVRGLSDAQLEVLQLVRRGAVWIEDGNDHAIVGSPEGISRFNNPALSVERGIATKVSMQAANIAAVRKLLDQLAKRDPALVNLAQAGTTAQTFHVTSAGEMVLTLIEDVPVSPADRTPAPP